MDALYALTTQFKQKLQQETVIGPFSKTMDPGMVEALGYAGFDFVILDMEHGPNSVETVQSLIRAAVLSGMLPIVRVKEDCAHIMGEVLDIGAGGIQVPQITSAADVLALIKTAKFHPQGARGVCRFVRAAAYSAMDRYEYFKRANEALIIIQLEGLQALENLEEILGVLEGVDIIFIGPYDLSQSLGVPGQVGHPLVIQKMQEIVELCAEKQVVAGTFVDTIEDAAKWMALGVRYISYSVDVGILYEAGRSILHSIQMEQK